MKIKRKRYVHYGNSKFVPEIFEKESLERFSWHNKPTSGFWGTPISGYYRWDRWCKDNDYKTDSLEKKFYFHIGANARILKVRDFKDIERYLMYVDDRTFESYKLDSIPNEKNRGVRLDFTSVKIDFETISKYYDGMEVIMSRNTYPWFHNGIFCCWDVDSIVVWNPGCICPE